AADLAGLDSAQYFLQSVDVHCLGEAIVNRLFHQWMIRDFAVAHDMLQARELIWENCSQKIFRFHPLQRRSDLRAATETRHGKRTGCVPAPADREHWRVEQRLNQKVTNCFGIHIPENFLERK